MAGWEQMRGDKLIVPAWLASLAHDAKVEAFAAQELQQFVAPTCGQKTARDIILDMTGLVWFGTSWDVFPVFLSCTGMLGPPLRNGSATSPEGGI